MVTLKATVLPIPTFALSKVPVADTVTRSPVSNSAKVAALTSMVAVVLPLYVLLLAVMPAIVKAFGDTVKLFASVVAVKV